MVCRYVERNALRAGLVARAEAWRWTSLWQRSNGRGHERPWLAEWPVVRPRQWVDWVNKPQTGADLETLRRCVTRGQPYGSAGWMQRVARRLGLEGTFRPRGRPKESYKGSGLGSRF